jgi:hypothetical protein
VLASLEEITAGRLGEILGERREPPTFGVRHTIC